MSVYLFVEVLLILGAVLEYYSPKQTKPFYRVMLCVLGFMLCFRYGQGTDYFGYERNYNLLGKGGSVTELLSTGVHGEIGWNLLCIFLNRMRCSFELFVVLISVFEAYCCFRFLNRFCPNGFVALLTAYHTFYLTYLFSALRQGIVMCIFLGFLLEWLFKKKYYRYIVVTLLCCLIHSVAAIFLLLPLIRVSVLRRTGNLKMMVFGSLCFGLLIATGLFNGILEKVLPSSVAYYFSGTTISKVAVLERVFMYVIVMCLYRSYQINCGKWGHQPMHNIHDLIILYSFGVMIYGVLLWNPLVASRTGYLLKVLEVALLSIMAASKMRKRYIVVALSIFMSVLMTSKNINTFILEGQYYGFVNLRNYPYVSLMNKEQIEEVRLNRFIILDEAH